MVPERPLEDFTFQRFHVDLDTQEVRPEEVRCADLEDVLGGIARGFKLLQDRPVEDAYAPEATLVLNLGLLSGTEFMTGLRTFFHAYSPLKCSRRGAPAAIWTAGSGKFATKLRSLGVEEIVFEGRAVKPTLLHISPGPEFAFLDASDLRGKYTNDKIQELHRRYPEAHFAVLGPAGESYAEVRYAAIALSTVNQLRSGDPKARFCGRGGIGGVMGSKNLLAIAADTPDRKGPAPPPVLKELNLEVARGEGSRRFRDRDKDHGGGGTWANYEALNPVHALPEMNFVPTGTDISFQLHRPQVEQGPYVIKDEACYRCGIRCHKNVYDPDEKGKAGRFRAKLDYEPLNLLSSNVGLFDVDKACDLVELVDQLGMDSISLGGTLAYACEYNRRHPEDPIADGLRYGDAEALARTIRAIGTGRMPALGQGTKRLSEERGETGYAMHCKGMEFPAYLPQTNPGYPFALAGGHMSLRTYLLLLYERETGLDYWVDAITRRGPTIMRDDLLGVCKFAGLSDKRMGEAIAALTGLEVTAEELKGAVRRTYLRGYRIERRQGFGPDDYAMPAEVHEEYPQIELPYFNSRKFFEELKGKVLARFDAMVEEDL
ncbi:MAG: aldehyde ferredoxin oxidoreductase C-terminal domain-containing protein [Planctomycetota bacterium]|jgi:aldehyde:ferredoxin oxidoreductase